MPHVMFKRVAGLAQGAYLLGHYSWSSDMRIVSATAYFSPPSASTIVSLLIDGADSGYSITLLPGATYAEMSVGGGVLVSAGSQIRFKVSSAPTKIDDYATNISIVAFAVDDDFASEPEPVSQFRVNWRNGYENFHLFSYDTSTHTYSELVTGLSTGRATVSEITATIQGSVTYDVLDTGSIRHANWVNDPSYIPSDPAIEFLVGDNRVAVVTAAAFFVPTIIEASSLDTEDNFCFYSSSGTLTATLGTGGLSALAITEYV